MEMRGEIATYNTLVSQIKPAAERVDAKGKDTFKLIKFWRANKVKLPAFSYVLRAVLAHSVNSCPPERLFSILNDTFEDDMDRSYADYIELSLWLQYNERCRQNDVDSE